MPRLDISWCVFDELIEEEEEEEEAWTGWYETLLKTRGWFPRVHVEEHIYIYIHVEKERELYEFRCETKSLGSKMVVIYAGRK